MRTIHVIFAAVLPVAGSAHAQLLETPSPWLEARPVPQTLNITPSPDTAPPGYMRNEAERPESDLKNRWRSDPRFVFGLNLNRYLAVEGGYLERQDRGWHQVSDSDPGDAGGALGVRGFHFYGAGKLTLPLTDKLSAYGLLGMNYSERRGGDQAREHAKDVDVGLFSKFGGEYKLDDKSTLTVTGQKFGNTAQKWGGATNANVLRAALNIGL